MKLHRFIGDFDLRRHRLRISDREQVHQIKKVLRFRPGSRFILADGKLTEAVVRIVGFLSEGVDVEIERVGRNENEPGIYGTAYVALPKREHFELAVEKMTEAGVREIVPVVSARTVKLRMNSRRLEKIIREAAEQSGRGVLPILRPVQELEAALAAAAKNALNLFFDPSGVPLGEWLHQSPDSAGSRARIGIFVGPEGGWTEEEIQSARAAKCIIVSLGKLTLRAETAAIVAVYLTLHLRELVPS